VARANALTWAGVFTFVQGEEAAGRALIAEARTTARAVGDGRAIAWATLMLAIAERSTLPTPGLEVPRRLAEEALALYREDGDRSGIAKSLMVLAGFAQAMGDLGEARRFARESLTTARAAGDRWVIAQALEVLGDLTGAEDDATARVLLVECRALYGEMGEIPGLASVEIRLGRLECRHGRYARAREHYRASLRSSRQSGWIDRTLRSLGGLATVAAGLGQLECAVRLGAACANLVDTTGVRLPPNEQAELDRAVASAERAMGEKGRAEAWAAEPAMTLEQAIAYALRQDCRAHDGATHPS
jgi:tetratricopeptide (TPR) repeat protein